MKKNKLRTAVSVLGFYLVVYSLFLSGCTINEPIVNMANKNQNEVLLSHNQFRQVHGAPHLVWDNALAHLAAEYASHCQFKHSRLHYGENLAAGYPSMKSAVTAWYAENRLYSYQHPGFSKATGHFTQLVWKSTQRIGCGYAVCEGKNGTPGTFLVCEYSPAGNVINSGYFERNVLRS